MREVHKVLIEPRFTGFPGTALGAYAAGLIAGQLEGPEVEVTLRTPPPLGRFLTLASSGGWVTLHDGETLVAEGTAARLELEVPEAVSLEVAELASAAYPGVDRHLFPDCFVCGPRRVVGDGLRLFTGPVPDRDLVAAVWTPHASLADDTGSVRLEFLWSAADCPTTWAYIFRAPQESDDHAVLGRLAAKVIGRVDAEKPYVVMAWPIRADQSKLFAGVAILSEDGLPLFVAQATWVLTSWGCPMSRSPWGLS
ncbi:MAG: hypothetical protein NVSMB29_03150 [Candidatus Dormibacteria bacterium]